MGLVAPVRVKDFLNDELFALKPTPPVGHHVVIVSRAKGVRDTKTQAMTWRLSFTTNNAEHRITKTFHVDKAAATDEEALRKVAKSWHHIAQMCLHGDTPIEVVGDPAELLGLVSIVEIDEMPSDQRPGQDFAFIRRFVPMEELPNHPGVDDATLERAGEDFTALVELKKSKDFDVTAWAGAAKLDEGLELPEFKRVKSAALDAGVGGNGAAAAL